MGIDTSIYSNIQQPNTLGNLGNLVNVASGVQNYQSGQINLQVQQQANRERQAVLPLMSQFMQPDGTFDLQKAGPAIMSVAPQTGADYISKLAGTNQATAIANNDLLNYDKNTIDQVGQTLSTLAGKSYTDQRQGLESLRETLPQSGKYVDQLEHVLTMKGIDNQDGRDDALNAFAMRSKTLGEQKSLQTPTVTSQTTIGTEGGPNAGKPVSRLVAISPTWANGGTAQGGVMPGTEAPLTVSPEGLNAVSTDVLGNQVVVHRTAGGSVSGVTNLGQIGGARGLMPPPATSFPPGESLQSRQELMNFRTQANQAAATTGGVRDNLNQIVNLADQISAGKPGQASAAISRLTGYEVGGDNAANLQRMGHYMALQSQMLANQMGVRPTDAGGQQAEQLVGKQDWDPAAIKSTAKTVDAYNSGVAMFNQGMEAAIKNAPPGSDVFPVRAFRNAWSQSFSVDAMRLYNGAAAGPKEYEKVKSEILAEPNGAQAFADAQSRAIQLRSLSKGQIPQ